MFLCVSAESTKTWLLQLNSGGDTVFYTNGVVRSKRLPWYWPDANRDPEEVRHALFTRIQSPISLRPSVIAIRLLA